MRGEIPFPFYLKFLRMMGMDVQLVATGIVKKLVNAGYTAYFAGGWVRDHLMGYPSDDIDIATNAPPDVIVSLFPRTILIGIAFGIVVVVIDGHQFEVATFRRDIDYVNGRKPTSIELASAEEDALRRDFTINGMFYDPLEGVVHDFVNGAADIKLGIIRAIGDPDARFVEDRLRMVRAIRFAARFGFAIDQQTQDAITANADTLFPAVAIERVWDELKKLGKYPRYEMAMIEMHRLGLLQVIFPGLKELHLREIKNRVAAYNHFPEGAETVHYVMQLFPKATPEEAVELCRYLHTSNAEGKLAEYLARMRRAIESERELGVADLNEWAHLYAHPALEVTLGVIAAEYDNAERKEFLDKHRQQINRLHRHVERIVAKKPLVNAARLEQEGVLPGKRMGLLIREAERIAIFHDLNDTEEVMKALKASNSWSNEETKR